MLSIKKASSLARPLLKRNVDLTSRSMTILSKESKEEHKKEVSYSSEIGKTAESFFVYELIECSYHY